MRSEMELNNLQAASTPQAGSEDGIEKMMIKFNIPLTRENYLDLAYMGDVPDELSAEEEAELPEHFRNPDGD